jgi:hypothetical protein
MRVREGKSTLALKSFEIPHENNDERASNENRRGLYVLVRVVDVRVKIFHVGYV